MPTPFYHLYMAEELLCRPDLPVKLSQFLHASVCAFLFGNIAPDVQVVSNQKREQTHFFNLPIQKSDPQPWELLLSVYPRLADTKRLSAVQTAFLAGYLCHLQADWIWVKDIFAPVFGPKGAWGTFEERLYLHNVLRAYLDVRILPKLHHSLSACQSQVEPDDWLPFVDDVALIKWRDMVFPQLQPGAVSQTVEVFCSRQRISIPEFKALLESEERMRLEVFEHLPLQNIQYYHQRVLRENIRLLAEYVVFPIRDVVSKNICDEMQGATS